MAVGVPEVDGPGLRVDGPRLVDEGDSVAQFGVGLADAAHAEDAFVGAIAGSGRRELLRHRERRRARIEEDEAAEAARLSQPEYLRVKANRPLEVPRPQ